jgi:CBS domain-containing protein
LAQAFDISHAPFDRLSPSEVEQVRAALDIGYFRPGETIIARDSAPDSFFIVIKGQVEERDGADLVSLRGPGDGFDSRALVQGGGSNAFVAREETLCHLLARDFALKLINRNPRFAAFFYLDISRKLEAAASAKDELRSSPYARARVSDLRWQAAETIPATASLEAATRRMNEFDVKALMVIDGERTGLITKTDLADAAILSRLPLGSPVGPIAQYKLIAVEADDFVARALMQMTKHNKRRVVIRREGEFVGILEDIDLLSFLAGNARLVAARIDRASSIMELAAAAGDIQGQTRLLRRQGVKIEVVSEIVSDLNRQLLAKTFRQLAPASILRKGCLIVMGSEGRGEQTIRTDQDNGLILSEPVPEADLEKFRLEFTAALERFGFPPCPGNVMVRNPVWSKTVEEFRADFRAWLALRDENAFMNVAIFYDAEAAAGDPELLAAAKSELVGLMSAERVMLAHFARAADQFPSPIGLFNNLVVDKAKGDSLDLKKGGIFPIVHGVRALALEHRLVETSTAARVERLFEAGALSRELGRELVEALRYLMTLKLDAELGEAERASLVRPAELSTMERDLLRDALQIVKKFREFLRRHFNLQMF